MAKEDLIHVCKNQAQMLMKSGFAFVLYGIVLSYLMKIEEECDCTNSWMHDTLKKGSILFIAIAALGLVPQLCGILNQNIWVVSTIAVFKLAYLVLLIVYIWKLKRGQCQECSDDWRRLGIEVYLYIVFALLLIALLYPVIVMLMYNTCRACKIIK